MRAPTRLAAALAAGFTSLAAAQTDVTVAPTNWTTEGGSVWREGTIGYDGSGEYAAAAVAHRVSLPPRCALPQV